MAQRSTVHDNHNHSVAILLGEYLTYNIYVAVSLVIVISTVRHSVVYCRLYE